MFHSQLIFKITLCLFFNKEGSSCGETFSDKTATQLFNSACCWHLKHFQWSDLTLVSLPSTYKHFVLDSDELNLLLDCYKILYSNKHVEFALNVARKYSTIRLGSKMDCWTLRSARIMASLTAKEGSINISAPCRPGVVICYVPHSVKLNGEFYEHALAVVWWYKSDCNQDHYGKPTQVWKYSDYVHCGAAMFMPVQRIKNRFACCSIKLNGEEKLVVSPIPRLFYWWT